MSSRISHLLHESHSSLPYLVAPGARARALERLARRIEALKKDAQHPRSTCIATRAAAARRQSVADVTLAAPARRDP